MRNCLVVLNYNDYETTSNFIMNIKNYNSIYKIVVVDNNSNDSSYERLCTLKSEKVHVIKSDKNGGYSYGNNIGIKYSILNFNPDYIIISNPDVLFENDVVNKMNEMYNNEPNLGIVAPIMIDKSGQISAWKLPTILDDIMSSTIVLSKIMDKVKKKYKFDKKINYVDVISGSFFMIPSSVLQEIDYLDEDTFLYCEERILAYKLKEKGYKNIILSEVNFIHEHSTSINKSIDSKVNRMKIYKESKLVYHKKYTGISKIQYIFLNILLTLGIIERKMIYKILNR